MIPVIIKGKLVTVKFNILLLSNNKVILKIS